MKNIISIFVLSLWLITGISKAQDITNTLGTNGSFIVKDSSSTFLLLDQATGNLLLNNSLTLPNTNSSTIGVINIDVYRFIHNYGFYNTFLGINSGNFTMYGLFNTATGYQALFSNFSGFNNTTNGSNSLYSNTSGNNNTANGYQALFSNTTGFKNTANGANALYSNTTGYENIAVGYNSLYSNLNGWDNTAVGLYSLLNNTGNSNTAIGFNAGSNVTMGANLTLIGTEANPSSPTAFNEITLGNNFVGTLRCNVTTITSLSDARDKKNITDLSLGLDFIAKLKPRQFNWDKRDWYDDNKSDGSKMKEEPTAGFIAQELDEAQTKENAEWLNLVLKDNPEKWEATPGNLFPVLVKAVQELAIKNEELTIKNDQLTIRKNEEIAELKNKNQNLEERLTKFEEMQTVLVKKIEQIESSERMLKVQIVNSENNNQ